MAKTSRNEDKLYIKTKYRSLIEFDEEKVYKVMIEYLFNKKTPIMIANHLLIDKKEILLIIDKFLSEYRTNPDFAAEVLNYKAMRYQNGLWKQIDNYIELLISEESINLTEAQRQKICDEITRLQFLDRQTKKRLIG